MKVQVCLFNKITHPKHVFQTPNAKTISSLQNKAKFQTLAAPGWENQVDACWNKSTRQLLGLSIPTRGQGTTEERRVWTYLLSGSPYLSLNQVLSGSTQHTPRQNSETQCLRAKSLQFAAEYLFATQLSKNEKQTSNCPPCKARGRLFWNKQRSEGSSEALGCTQWRKVIGKRAGGYSQARAQFSTGVVLHRHNQAMVQRRKSLTGSEAHQKATKQTTTATKQVSKHTHLCIPSWRMECPVQS